MKYFLILTFFTVYSSLLFGQESSATGKAFNKVQGIIVSKSKFNLSGTSDDKSFRKAVYKQIKEYIATNIDEEIFKAAQAYNIIKFEHPYLNFSVWIDNKGKPDISFFGSNIDSDKAITRKLKMIISQLHFDEHFHAGLKQFTNRQLTVFIALEKVVTNEKSTFIVRERTEEEQVTLNNKNNITYPAYFPSCNSTEVKTDESFKEIKDCMKYQLIQYMRNNFDKDIARVSLNKLRSKQNISKPKLKAWISFKFDENGKPCEYQIISLFPKIEKEVLKVIKTIPTATPAELNEKAIKYKYRFPLRFY